MSDKTYTVTCPHGDSRTFVCREDADQHAAELGVKVEETDSSALDEQYDRAVALLHDGAKRLAALGLDDCDAVDDIIDAEQHLVCCAMRFDFAGYQISEFCGDPALFGLGSIAQERLKQAMAYVPPMSRPEVEQALRERIPALFDGTGPEVQLLPCDSAHYPQAVVLRLDVEHDYAHGNYLLGTIAVGVVDAGLLCEYWDSGELLVGDERGLTPVGTSDD
jgi:hypothetical protein